MLYCICDLINVQVYGRRMVEADVLLNFDPHSHTSTTNPMPTNSPILPFLVLTMAGGCGVSNLMKQAGNNSWVCVEMGLEGEKRQRGRRGIESRHKCPCQSRGPAWERESCTDRDKEPKMAASQSSRKGDGGVSAPLSECESLLSGWMVWAHARSLRQAGRQAQLQWARLNWNRQRGKASGLRGPEFVRAGFEGWAEAEPRATTAWEVWHQISSDSEPFTYFLMFSSLTPSLHLIGWED